MTVLSVLLAAVIVFNLLGYFVIYRKTVQSRGIEDAVAILNDQEMLCQQMVQTIAVLSIHDSFTSAQASQQQRVLKQETVRFKTNQLMLDELHQSGKLGGLLNDPEVLHLFGAKQSYNDSIFLAAGRVLKDSTAAYLTAFSGTLQRYAFRLQQVQHSLIIAFREKEGELESSVRYWNGALVFSLLIALLLIVLLITAPTLKLNRKTREEAERKIGESEQKYWKLFHSNPVPIWIYDPLTLRFLEVNQMAVRHYGYSEAEFMSMTIMDIRPPVEAERLGKILNGQEDAGQLYSRGVWTHLKKNGQTILVDVISHGTLYQNRQAVLVLANDVTGQMEWQQRVMREKIERQREIARATIAVQERERNEIGKELHDNVSQMLTTAKLHLDHMGNGSGDKEKHRTISMELINTVIGEIRRLSRSLVPASLKDVGLIASMEELVDHINLLGILKIGFITEGVEEEALDPGLALALYRIVQEQTTNILKYAEATEVVIELKQKGRELCLIVRDNGKGFDPSRSRKGVGLSNIVNRADVYQGTVDIYAAPGKGCVIKVCFLLLPAREARTVQA